jgi:hypothetical protein
MKKLSAEFSRDVKILFKNALSFSRTTSGVLFGHTVAIHGENHMRHINTMWGKMLGF